MISGSPHDVNRITLDSYDVSPSLYEERTPPDIDGEFKKWIDSALAIIPSDASILEIGSGTGRDADYMENAGFRVQRTEASAGLRDRLISRGPIVTKLNVLSDDIPSGYEMIFANAVLHHFDADQLRGILSKMHDALGPGGVIAFSVKEGNGEVWETKKLGQPRYFLHWTKDGLGSVVADAGFEIVELRDQVEGSNGELWIHAIARHK